MQFHFHSPSHSTVETRARLFPYRTLHSPRGDLVILACVSREPPLVDAANM
jgi:hypothetical protein